MSYVHPDAILTDLLKVPVNVPFGCGGSIYRVTNYNNLQVKFTTTGWSEVHPAEAIAVYTNRDKIKILEEFV